MSLYYVSMICIIKECCDPHLIFMSFLLISKDKSKDLKTKTVLPADQQLLHDTFKNIRSRMKVSGKGKTQTSLIWIHERQQPVSAVNTAMNQVLTLTPLNIAEAKVLATLYDAVRVKSIKFRLHLSTVNNVGVPANPALVADAIAVFDYSSSTAMTNVALGLEFRHHVGPLACSGSGYANSPGADSLQGGFMSSDLIKLSPTPIVDPGILADFLGGQWVGSSDTGVQVGFIKTYVEACGAGVASSMNIYISYLMEYKNRG